jgi:hypothetical protein
MCWCGGGFSHTSGLSRHRRVTGHGSAEAEAEAGAGRTTTGLELAAALASGREKMVCKVCQRAFKRTDNLQQHMRLMHPSKAHICPVCGDELPSEARLAAHRASHRVDILAPLKELEAYETEAMARDREVWALRCDLHVSSRGNAKRSRGTEAVECAACKKAQDATVMGYTDAMVASGAAQVCVSCLQTRGTDGVAAVTAERRRLHLVRLAEAEGFRVVDVPGDGWCLFHAVRKATGCEEINAGLLDKTLQHMLATQAELLLEDGKVRAEQLLRRTHKTRLGYGCDTDMADLLPQSLATVVGRQLDVWMIGPNGRVVRQLLGTAGDIPPAVLLRYFGEIGLAHYAAAVAPVPA